MWCEHPNLHNASNTSIAFSMCAPHDGFFKATFGSCWALVGLDLCLLPTLICQYCCIHDVFMKYQNYPRFTCASYWFYLKSLWLLYGRIRGGHELRQPKAKMWPLRHHLQQTHQRRLLRHHFLWNCKSRFIFCTVSFFELVWDALWHFLVILRDPVPRKPPNHVLMIRISRSNEMLHLLHLFIFEDQPQDKAATDLGASRDQMTTAGRSKGSLTSSHPICTIRLFHA